MVCGRVISPSTGAESWRLGKGRGTHGIGTGEGGTGAESEGVVGRWALLPKVRREMVMPRWDAMGCDGMRCDGKMVGLGRLAAGLDRIIGGCAGRSDTN